MTTCSHIAHTVGVCGLVPNSLPCSFHENKETVIRFIWTPALRVLSTAEPCAVECPPAPMHDMPAALALLEQRSVQNDALRQQKRWVGFVCGCAGVGVGV